MIQLLPCWSGRLHFRSVVTRRVKWDNPRYFRLDDKPEEVFVVVCGRAYRCKIGGNAARPLNMPWFADQVYYLIFSGLSGTLVVFSRGYERSSTWNGVDLAELDAEEFELEACELPARELKDACKVRRVKKSP